MYLLGVLMLQLSLLHARTAMPLNSPRSSTDASPPDDLKAGLFVLSYFLNTVVSQRSISDV